MKICTLLKVTGNVCGVITDADVVDLSLVDDDHLFGWEFRPDGEYLHYEGTVSRDDDE